MVSKLLTSTQIIYVLFYLGIIQYIFISNCQCASNHYFISNNGSSYSSSNSISLNNNYGNSLTIEPAYDIKCKEENTVDNEVCAKFSIGDENQGFIYSPNYPNNYPNTTECARCIEAPHGRFIKIEFRDSFNMEESASCEYDKLEIRNGKFGYSDLLATLCGHDFPNEISSSDRFLWLRFKSDESIEYPGFKIFYQFIPLASPKPIPPRDCSDDIRGQSSGFISQENISIENIEYSNKHNAPLECVWTIEVEPKNKMYINFLQYTLEKPNDCEMNYIDIYEENFNEEKRKQRFCGTSTEPFKSDGNKVRIRFHAKPGALRAKFSLLYTSFRETQNKEKCDPASEFDCNDGTCIDIKLKCNDEHNCKYRYDEDKSLCQTDGSGLASLADNHMIVILVVFFALVIGMCASIVVSCWGKIQERRQREIDYKMRVSSHPSLDAIDRINLVLGSKQHLPSAGFNPTSAQQQQMLNARYKHQLLLNSRNNSEEADADAMLNSLAKEEQDDEEGCYLPELDGSLLILDESNSYSDQVHTHPSSVAPTSSRIHLRNAPQVQHSINSQNTDLISPTDSCPLFYHLHRPPTANSGNIHLLQQQASQTQTESLKSGSNDSESPIPPPPPPPTFSHLRQRQIAAAQAASQSQRQTPVSNLSANHNHYSSSGSQPDLSKLIDNQRANLAHSMHHYPAGQYHFQHYIPNANSYRAISPTQQTSAILDDFYHQHAFQVPNGSLHNAVSHPYLAQTAKNQNREILHLSQHNLNSHPSLQHSQYNSRQRLLQPQSSQQSNHELSNTTKANVHHHHPDCAAVVKSGGHFYQHNSPIKHTPSHKINTNQNFQNKQLLDEDSIDEIGNQNYPVVRRHPTMHNQTQLFGMSKPSNLINSSQDEECCESDLASINGNQDNGHLNRALDYADENEEEDVIEEDIVPHHTLTQKRPQIRTQFSSNSNNDSNESGVGGDLSAQLNGSQSKRSLAGLNDEKFVPLSANRLQQCYSKIGSTRAEINEVGGSNTANSSLTPSQQTQNSQQLQQQRNFVETHCAPDAVVLR